MACDLSKFRNIGIMAHIDAGKTTTSERILYYSGKNHKVGEVHNGTATMDWMVQEQERGITITSAATTVFWDDYRINLIDTPGHVDFTIEVERSLRVLDGAIAVFDAANGVEPQSETVWRQADRYHVPRIAFLNKMDKIGADVEMCLTSMKDKLGANPILMQLPCGIESSFRGCIDLVSMKMCLWKSDDKDSPMEFQDIPSDQIADAQLYRLDMVEKLSDYDDAMADCVLSDTTPTASQVHEAIRKCVLAAQIVPVFLGTAFKNKGIQSLLDAVVRYLPSPLDKPPAHGLEVPGIVGESIRLPKETEPFSAIVFKIMTDPFVGSLSYLRVYSGVLKIGDSVQNVLKGKKERVTKIYRMHANDREDVDLVGPGEIVACVGLKFSVTGDTLCAPEAPIAFESMIFPEPVISLAIEPKSSADLDKLQTSLARLVQEDPSLKVGVSKETGQVLISGMGELHLQIIVDRLMREFKVDANVGKPQVAYRESVAGLSSCRESFSRQVQTKQYTAFVQVSVMPSSDRTEAVTITFSAKSDLPVTVKSAISDALLGAAGSGALCGYPVVNMQINVEDYGCDPTAIDEVSFKVAASNAMRGAMQAAKPIMMEPIMKVEVVVPSDFSGPIVADISSRRGQVHQMDSRGHLQIVHAELPLAGLFGYETDIRSLSQGRASSSMIFSHYAAVSKQVQDKLLGLD